MVNPRLTKLIEDALAARGPLTLTSDEVRELAADVGIEDPTEIIEPIAGDAQAEPDWPGTPVEWPYRGRGYVGDDGSKLPHPHGAGSSYVLHGRHA